ncbi:integral membrane protein, putative [Paecilomyces variotii No. 5]|uniref:Integral membrane protein, putative n=1 Tax=Byssochlamys spectabilis (strain No. 5 / NBRC 109023) TaxID=1356009 RepID=V5I427_BYSSN|nr:integral membrane protein, putative [Paecilomyces variotii No. 5]
MASISTTLSARGLGSQGPPPIETKLDNNPTLLISWWATGFSLVIILVRVCGRYIRTERFFPEDKVMMASIIPLLIRMAFIHVVLIWGTNNTQTEGLSEIDIRHREIGSRLVLVARIFYAIFIWTAKYTVCEFLSRVTGITWRRSIQLILRFLYYFLATTLIAVIISTLAECQPFDHYWQVVPDPGPRCRSGYANLITMGACDVITDVLLVAFPIPLILKTTMPLKRKIALVLLFALSLVLVAITCYRVPTVIRHHGSQQRRSVIASLEILAATAVSNAVVIGSFIRDRGIKKPKFKQPFGSISTSDMDRSSVRRPTFTHHQWGSDTDLASELGFRLHPDLQDPEFKSLRPAPLLSPRSPAQTGSIDPNWSFNRNSIGTEDDRVSADDSLGGQKISPHEYIETNHTPHNSAGKMSPRKVSFFDVGGLLDEPVSPTTPAPASRALPDRVPPVPDNRYRRGSRALLEDVGGLLSTGSGLRIKGVSRPRSRTRSTSRHSSKRGLRRSSTSPNPAPPYRAEPEVSSPTVRGNMMELQDAGGLLSRNRFAETEMREYGMELRDPGGLLSRDTHAGDRR